MRKEATMVDMANIREVLENAPVLSFHTVNRMIQHVNGRKIHSRLDVETIADYGRRVARRTIVMTTEGVSQTTRMTLRDNACAVEMQNLADADAPIRLEQTYAPEEYAQLFESRGELRPCDCASLAETGAPVADENSVVLSFVLPRGGAWLNKAVDDRMAHRVTASVLSPDTLAFQQTLGYEDPETRGVVSMDVETLVHVCDDETMIE